MQQSLQISSPAAAAARPELSTDQADAWDALAEALAQAGVDLVAEELAPPQPGRARVMAVLGKAGSGKTLLLAEMTRALVAAARRAPVRSHRTDHASHAVPASATKGRSDEPRSCLRRWCDGILASSFEKPGDAGGCSSLQRRPAQPGCPWRRAR